jgi:hypothetical protein
MQNRQYRAGSALQKPSVRLVLLQAIRVTMVQQLFKSGASDPAKTEANGIRFYVGFSLVD